MSRAQFSNSEKAKMSLICLGFWHCWLGFLQLNVIFAPARWVVFSWLKCPSPFLWFMIVSCVAGSRWELTVPRVGHRVVFFLGFILVPFHFACFLIPVPTSLSLSVCFSFCSLLSTSLCRTFVFSSSQLCFSCFTAISFVRQLCGTWFSLHFYLRL